ncbi:hypothetical protein [Labilibaculum euxinus]|uniref:hypothetical protein n=1 Tax=Labilibaculum euxinus TaxID=2686357 RepID=UPI000FF65B47|nr:hypothetical protein [Labilibaculum euxinus]
MVILFVIRWLCFDNHLSHLQQKIIRKIWAAILGVGEVGENRHLNPGPSPRGEGSLLLKMCRYQELYSPLLKGEG